MPRSREGRTSMGGRHASPAGIKIPLNDDDAEKAKRLKKRSMLQEVQIRRQSFANAGTPRKGLDDGEGSVEGTPKTPRNVSLLKETANPITPLRRAPLVVNFEEWMKMANDNKINAQNSWNFALIDYFHDMSLLKEGEGINFQKASCTLDGCVKIYTSRVDSVATETGKLLSGLADSGGSNNKKARDDDEEGGGGEDDDDNGEGKKKKKRTQRSSEATLAKDFSSLQLKKLELEFSVDPLFKKASADFDEGGAKGLLLNHLSIDNKGRIVFDSSDDIEEVPEEEEENENGEKPSEEIDLGRLRQQFFPDLAKLDELYVCPSLKNFDLGDPSGSLDIPFLKALEEKNDQTSEDSTSPDFSGAGGFDDDDDDFGLPGADGTMAFGDGGVVWANETLADAADRFLTPSKPRSAFGDEEEGGEVGGGVPSFGLGNIPHQDDILSYFDEALKKNWAGPEHWKIKKIKDTGKPPPAARPRKEKEAFEINFMDPVVDVTQDMLLPQSNATIDLPKAQRKSKNRHLLPEDRNFNSRNLIQLFIKPNAHLGHLHRRGGPGGAGSVARPSEKGHHNLPPPVDVENVEMNEEFWAKQQMEKEAQAPSTPVATGAYDANFFNDDGMDMLPPGLNDPDDDDDFGVGGEAFEQPLPSAASESTNGAAASAAGSIITSSSALPFPSTQEIAMGSQLVAASRRVRPEYVQYAKVAKKVDVRRLKENIWKQLGMDMVNPTPQKSAVPNPAPAPTPAAAPLPKTFTEVIHNLQRVYPKEAMSDISTSYCFICVLHLANEKGLVLESNETMTDLRIEKDLTANGPDAY
ncbi:condensin complex subunit 2/barren [Kalaharituber pfeilii]|nr:condensin complex subunit 2/barren [Kalaharituber pfeilii]